MSGWLPQRAHGTSPDFPILGTGQYDWKGYDPTTHTAAWLPAQDHPHVTDQGYLVSWNNKQAPQWSAADDLPGGRFAVQTLRDRCRAPLQSSLRAALAVTPQQLYGSVCPADPEPACADQNRYTYASAIALPPFPFQNRPTFQQVVTLTQHLPR
jgi:hypothetical protein